MIQRVLLTGADGQLGQSLVRTKPEDIELLPLGIEDLDITVKSAVRDRVNEFDPDAIINAAAYTAVDQAEVDPETAWAVNRDGVSILAAEAQSSATRLVQVSTDFVFDGRQSHPYLPDDAPAPLSVYGSSKLGGEEAVRNQAGLDWVIVRTAWVYAAGGHNFVNTMLRLMQQGTDLRVVADQMGCPTYAGGLAEAIWQGLNKEITGVHHWTDAGVASWYDFAVAIQEEALSRGLLERPVSIAPIRTQDYPVPAKRPSYSVLDKTATWQALEMTSPHWRDNLRIMLSEIHTNNP